MLQAIYIVLMIAMIGFFILAFFTKHEIIWGIAIILSAIVMASSYTLEVSLLTTNSTMNVTTEGNYTSTQLTTQAQEQLTMTPQWPLAGIGLLFFSLSVLLLLFDMFNNFGSSIQQK